MSHQEQQAVKNQKQASELFVLQLLKSMEQRDPQHMWWQPLSVDTCHYRPLQKGWGREGEEEAKMQECAMARHCTCVYMLYNMCTDIHFSL